MSIAIVIKCIICAAMVGCIAGIIKNVDEVKQHRKREEMLYEKRLVYCLYKIDGELTIKIKFVENKKAFETLMKADNLVAITSDMEQIITTMTILGCDENQIVQKLISALKGENDES